MPCRGRFGIKTGKRSGREPAPTMTTRRKEDDVGG